jgi:hypothetical protein
MNFINKVTAYILDFKLLRKQGLVCATGAARQYRAAAG